MNRRILVIVVATALLAPAPAAADHQTHQGTPVVAFLVNGYGGCCIPGTVKTMLRGILDEDGNRIVAVHVSNWNEIDQRGHPGAFPMGGTPDPYTDETFIQQVLDAVAKIDEGSPDPKLVFVGHSFGGDSVLQVARRLAPRKVALLAVLDPVGRGGLRATVTAPVPANVEYLYNRWQTNAPYPFGFLSDGHLSNNADSGSQTAQSVRRTASCKVKYVIDRVIPELMLHAQMPNDSCIQAQLKHLIQARLLNPNPRVDRASVVLGSEATRPVVGVHVRFAEPVNMLTFTLEDVVASPRPPTAVEAVAGSGGKEFVVRFDPFVLPETVGRMRVEIGPDIHDLDGNPLDQDLDLRTGETPDDRFRFEYGDGVPTVVIPKVVFLDFVFAAEARLQKLIAMRLRFDRSVAPAAATDATSYRIVWAGRDRRFGTIDDRADALRTARLDAAGRVVTLIPQIPIAATATFQLVVEGAGFASYRATFRGKP